MVIDESVTLAETMIGGRAVFVLVSMGVSTWPVIPCWKLRRYAVLPSGATAIRPMPVSSLVVTGGSARMLAVSTGMTDVLVGVLSVGPLTGTPARVSCVTT